MSLTLGLALLLQSLLWSACAQSAHQSGQYLFDRLVSKDLRQQIDQNVSFTDLKESPASYEGRTIMLSGVILKARRAKERTEIEILHVPPESSFGPAGDRDESKGRFLAVQRDGRDPALFEAGNPVTVIGDVRGSEVRPMDEGEYAYPVVEVKQIVDWKNTMKHEYTGSGPYPYYGGYYGYYPYQYYPYWSPYGYAPYSFLPYYPYSSGGFGRTAPAPSPPPAGSIPPQFKRDE